jgi:hypothetical protein
MAGLPNEPNMLQNNMFTLQTAVQAVGGLSSGTKVLAPKIDGEDESTFFCLIKVDFLHQRRNEKRPHPFKIFFTQNLRFAIIS